LKLANDVFKDNKNLKSYIELAGVNYGSVEMRTQKVESCLESISRVISKNMVTENKYEYLLPYKNVVIQSETDVNNFDEVKKTLTPYMQMSYKALYEVLD